ncbi:class A sortase [Candidatus Enterococcus ferrettii]|uniref:Sortase A n=1 Tax=Candidatus Enterococcus ferrettii TaxID=2815324 RepID=A0ABV0EWS0_9ENTE|nr:class A sortase [Enterococcus sp. 665A]MBO1342254.1 class A sortase [Enterococcus sp. 665A]
MKKKIVQFCSFLLIVVGLFLLFNKPLINYFVKNTGAAYDVNQLSKQDLEKNKQREAPFDFDQVKSLTSEAVLKSQLAGGKKELPVIASIAIPSVKIRLPIFKGLSNEALLYGAGTLSPDQEMGEGNYALASHRSDQPDLLFTPLENIILGDLIYLTDLYHVYTYEVIDKEKVVPTKTEVLDVVPEKKLLTLITCGDLYATNRLVVQAELIEVTPMKQLSKEAAQAFQLPIQSY